MSIKYCDSSTGNDTTGDGSSGTPWATIQKALDNVAAGDTIRLSNVAAFVLTSPLSFAGLTPSIAAPLYIESWDNGGSITVDTPNGVKVGAEIDGNDAVASLTASLGNTKTYIYFRGIKMHSTTGALIDGWTNWSFLDCECYDCGGTQFFSNFGGCYWRNCTIRDDGGTAVDGISLGSNGRARGNIICGVTGNGITCSGTNGIMEWNLIHDVGGHGATIGQSGNIIRQNTIDGKGTASKHGVNGTNSAFSGGVIENNLITNWSGTSAYGITIAAGSDDMVIGPNAFYNNTTNASYADAVLDLTADDVVESGDPYTNRAADDYTLGSGASSIGTASSPDLALLEEMTFGAFQPAPGGGGGGGSAAFLPVGNSFINGLGTV